MADLWRPDGSQFLDSNGDPLNGGKLRYYDAGTTNARTVYQDAAETVPWTQPVVLDSAGRVTAAIYITTGAFKETLHSSADVLIFSDDNIPGAEAAAEGSFASPERPIITKAASYTVQVADLGALFVVDPTGGNVTLTLPAAGLVASGRGIAVIHDGTANSVVVNGNGAETVNGSATLTLSKRYTFVELVSDGASTWKATNPIPFGGGTLTGSLEWPAAIAVASTATTDIGAAAGNLVTVSGTTTITGLGTAASGVARFVRFSGILTLTHNGTSLILPGGANITTAAGDTALFISEGSGNWRCHYYQRASGLPVAVTSASDAAAGVQVNAVQTDMEAATSTTLTVTPGRQHFHPGHPKCWARVNVAAGVPTLVTSYNITSITDGGVGSLTVTIATDFSSANWAALFTVLDLVPKVVVVTSIAAGSAAFRCDTTGGASSDPDGWSFAGLGDHT